MTDTYSELVATTPSLSRRVSRPFETDIAEVDDVATGMGTLLEGRMGVVECSTWHRACGRVAGGSSFIVYGRPIAYIRRPCRSKASCAGGWA
jgi:hypothetical protein